MAGEKALSSVPAMTDATKVERTLARGMEHRIERETIASVEKVVEDATAANARKQVFKEIVVKIAAGKATIKAAARAESLIPILGWIPSAMDAREGVRDVTHGNWALGGMTIGVAAVDILSDALHIGDLATGVGGTALSLTVQGWTIAMQTCLDEARTEGRLRELNQYIDEHGALPPDLESYFGLDDEEVMLLEGDLSGYRSQRSPIDPRKAHAAEERRKQQELAAFRAGAFEAVGAKPLPSLLPSPAPIPQAGIDVHSALGTFLAPGANPVRQQGSVVDVFEAQKAEFVEYAHRLQAKSENNILSSEELDRFRKARDRWIGQLREAIQIAENRGFDEGVRRRLGAIDDWIKNDGRSALLL
jgi:hypothetical protein